MGSRDEKRTWYAATGAVAFLFLYPTQVMEWLACMLVELLGAVGLRRAIFGNNSILHTDFSTELITVCSAWPIHGTGEPRLFCQL